MRKPLHIVLGPLGLCFSGPWWCALNLGSYGCVASWVSVSAQFVHLKTVLLMIHFHFLMGENRHGPLWICGLFTHEGFFFFLIKSLTYSNKNGYDQVSVIPCCNAPSLHQCTFPHHQWPDKHFSPSTASPHSFSLLSPLSPVCIYGRWFPSFLTVFCLLYFFFSLK